MIRTDILPLAVVRQAEAIVRDADPNPYRQTWAARVLAEAKQFPERVEP